MSNNIEHWSAVAATLVDLAKRDLPPHISEAEQVEAYLGLKRIAADYRGAVGLLRESRRYVAGHAFTQPVGDSVAAALLARIDAALGEGQ